MLPPMLCGTSLGIGDRGLGIAEPRRIAGGRFHIRDLRHGYGDGCWIVSGSHRQSHPGAHIRPRDSRVLRIG